LKSEKKKCRLLGNHSNDVPEAASDSCPLNQLKRKFCSLFVSENCPFTCKKIKHEEAVDVEINSPEIEKEEASKLGIIEIDEMESPLETCTDKLTDNLLNKKMTVRDNLLPSKKYFQSTPTRWLQCSDSKAIIPYVDAQQILLSSNGELKEDMVPDNVPSNDLLFDSYNYTHCPYYTQQQNEFFHNNINNNNNNNNNNNYNCNTYYNNNNTRYYDIDEIRLDEIGDVEEVDEELDMGMDVV
jgi:hypothetical protein